MPDIHSEVELKFDASGVDQSSFMAFCLAHKPFRYIRAISPDVYWEQGENVVRHRHKFQGGAGELTVKRRRSKTSTQDRMEVDLTFSHETTKEDVEKFLEGSGWARCFTLKKDAHIFYFDGGSCPVTVVLYTVVMEGEDRERVFLEIEAEKGTRTSISQAKRLVRSWRRALETEFKLGKPLNDSLYEIYSGKRYHMEGEAK